MASSKKLIQFYNHLEKTLEAGLSLPAALESAPGVPEEVTHELSRLLYSGQDTTEALQKEREHFPSFDLALLHAGAETGRLPQTCASLAEHHELKVATTNTVIGMLIYPLILLHFAAILFPVLSMIDLNAGGLQWDSVLYGERVFTALGIIWATIAFAWAFFSNDAPVIYKIRKWIPGVSGFQKHQALSRLSYALSAMLDAGINPSRAWIQAGTLSTDASLEAVGREIADGILSGNRPGNMLKDYPQFNREFIAFYQTGEDTGSLVETLQKQGALYAERARESLKRLGKILPTLILFIVVGVIGYAIVQAYSAYFSQIEEMLNGL